MTIHSLCTCSSTCKRVFRVQSQLEQHVRQVQPTTTSTTSTANDATITIKVDDQQALHAEEGSACAAEHAHERLDKYFPLMKDAKEWMESQELDTAFRTRDSRPNYAKFTCRHRRAVAPKSTAKGQRKRQDTVASLECHAQFVIKKTVVCQCLRDNPENLCGQPKTMFRLRGCIAHAHERMVRSLRIPQVTRNLIIGLLKNGVPNQTILRCATTNRVNLYDKIVTMQDIRNIAKRYAQTVAEGPSGPAPSPQSALLSETQGEAPEAGSHGVLKMEEIEAEEEKQRLILLEERRLTALRGLRDCVRVLEDGSALLAKEDLISQVEDLIAQRNYF
ncbi:hypothetical protein TCAL_08672 [Tigriopus californicus]|uniref:Uncharacterized protein n=1 Tax=Tigriopus californicus TaxID=6832 RepID=A0A553PDG3_TIGCA|nr:hypothetical protein TCAL_08672 [Tigriopus californicus]